MRRDTRNSRRMYDSGRQSSRYSANRSRSKRRDEYEETGGGFMPLLILFAIGIGIYIYSGRDWRQDFSTVKAMAQQYLPGQTVEEPMPVYKGPCTQANIAKIIAYTFLDEIPKATDPGEIWYKKYYTALAKDPKFGFFKEESAQKPLTYEETGLVLSNLLGAPGTVDLQGNETVKAKPISLKTFLEGYENALSYAKMGEGLTYETLGFVATPKINGGLGQWKVLTDKGIYGFEGLVLDPFLGKSVKAIVKDQEILGIIEAESNEIKVPECYITEVSNGQAKVKIGDLEMTYAAEALTEKEKDTIGTITLTDGKITAFESAENSALDTVLRIGKDTIEFEKGGELPYENMAVYDSTPEHKWTSLAQVSVGSRVEYGVKDGKVTSLNVSQRSDPDQMRVVVTADGLGEYAHTQVKITSEEGYTVQYGDAKTTLPAKEVWDAQSFAWESGKDKVVIAPQGKGGLTLASIERQKQNPTYQGQLEIYKEADGTYTVVNSLGMEDYIAGVVPSEMPSTFGIEAAKVQAISARSFARVHQNTNQFAKYGAQVDDTTSTQVYNNVPANEVSKKAANETKGMVLVYNNDVISGNFFSTSCGYTANFGETWANGEIFPTNTPVYLVSRQQYLGDRMASNLADEKDAYAFLTLKPEAVNAFDNKSSWFRWQVTMNAKELSSIVNSSIGRLTSESPNMVKVLSAEGKWEVGTIDTLGTITNLEVKKRGQGGNVMELILEGTKNTVKISTEYLIRSALAPIQKESGGESIGITRGDGTTVENMTLLPSAFFSPDITYDDENNLKQVTLFGGGFGHGVGMSQEGVKGMVDRGYTARQILGHYYPEIEIKTQE